MEGEFIIDGFIGYWLMGDLQGIIKVYIEWANWQVLFILVLDMFFGIEFLVGIVYILVVKVWVIFILVFFKKGLYEEVV